MANKILMPKLSPTMEEGQISSWVKEEGDAIEANETIAEVDTDKATMEVTSLEAGTLLKILIGAGDNAKLGETIAIIGEEGEDFSSLLEEIKKETSSNGASSGDAEKKESLLLNKKRRKMILRNKAPMWNEASQVCATKII